MIRLATLLILGYALYLTGFVQLYFAINPICIGGL